MAVAYQTSTTGTFTGTSLSANVPSGLAAGDTWVVVGCQDDDNFTAVAPSGWELVDARFNTTWPNGFAVLKTNCTGSETAQTISITGGSGGGLYHSIRLSGGHATTALDAVDEFAQAGSSTTIDAPDITVANDGSLAILVAVQNSFGTWTVPSGATPIADTTDGGSIKLGSGYEARDAGAYAPGNWTSSRNDQGRAALTFSIAPAAGGVDEDIEAAGSLSISGAADLSGSGTLAAAGALSIAGAADLDALGALAAAGAIAISGVADLDAAGTLSAAGAISIAGVADLDATGTLAAAGAIAITGAASLNAGDEIDIEAAGALSITGSADLDATGTLAAAGAVSIVGAADLDARGTLAAVGALSVTGAADLDALGTLAAAGAVSISGVAELTEADNPDMSAVGALSITGIAVLNASGKLEAAGALSITGAADLDYPIDIEAIGSLLISGAADLDATGALSAAGQIAILGAALLVDANAAVGFLTGVPRVRPALDGLSRVRAALSGEPSVSPSE